MPYIPQYKRTVLDPAIDQLLVKLEDLERMTENNTQGNLNYVITKILRETYGTYGNYQNINDAIGVLNCVAMEHYVRCAVPYEDGKIKENGDVVTDKEKL